MFSETLIESVSVSQPRRRWTALVSFIAQAALITALAIVPLLYPGSISGFNIMPVAPLTSPTMVTTTDRPAESTSHAPSTQVATIAVWRDPTLSYRTNPAGESGAPSAPENIASCCNGGGLPGFPMDGARTFIPKLDVKAEPPQRKVISHLDPGALVHRVEPTYPRIAIASRTQGDVILRAVIDRNGEVTSLTLVSGHPMLSTAAIDAVRQWRYRPYILNGQAIEVETQITVHFSLGS